MRGEPGGHAKGVRPHLVIKLKKDWTYSLSSRAFTKKGNPTFSPWEELPRNTRIQPLNQDLARAEAHSLSPPERELARTYHIVFPKQVVPADYLAVVQTWPSIEEAWLPPEVSLP